jgi:hypothetical protein
MNAEDIIEIIKRHLDENAPAMSKQPEDFDIIIAMGNYILCWNILNEIEPGSVEADYCEKFAIEEEEL